MDMRHVIEVYTPQALAVRYEADDAAPLQVGDRIVIDEIPHVISAVEHEFSPSKHVTRVTAGDPSRRTSKPGMTDFLRYHVLVRVFDGDIGRWLGVTRNPSDATFLRTLQRRVVSDPELLLNIREVVDTSGLWPDEPDA
jgi:hypothetical protein